jgi:hypothetical protein
VTDANPKAPRQFRLSADVWKLLSREAKRRRETRTAVLEDLVRAALRETKRDRLLEEVQKP